MGSPSQGGLRARRFKTPRTITALVLRDMSTTYGRSPGGYVWALLEPIGGIGMLVLILAIGLRIRTPSLGDSFAMFYGTGVLAFGMYQRVGGKIASAISSTRPLLYYPGVTYMDAIIARFVLNALTQAIVFGVVAAGIIIIFDPRVLIDLPPIIFGLAMAAALAFGIGSLNAFLFPLFPLWQSVWGILTFPLFLMSTIIYTYEELPPIGQQVLWYNPLVHIIGMVRRGIYPTYEALWVSPAYVMTVALVSAVFGHIMLGRYHRTILSRDYN